MSESVRHYRRSRILDYIQVLATNKVVFVADWLKKIGLATNKAVFVADYINIKGCGVRESGVNPELCPQR